MSTSIFIYYKHWLTDYAVVLSDSTVICRCKVAKSDYQLCHMHLSVHLHRRTQFPLDRFLLNLVLGTFLKIPVWLKSDKNTGHFTWRHKYVLLTATYVVQSTQQNTLLCFYGNTQYSILQIVPCVAKQHKRELTVAFPQQIHILFHCKCHSSIMATMTHELRRPKTWMHHHDALYIHCLSY
jgi:hypothetical protein